jgi:diketogulonate reductase-like aldo/keto reductase
MIACIVILFIFFSVGTFKIRGKEEVYSALKAALDAGYRLIGQ